MNAQRKCCGCSCAVCEIEHRGGQHSVGCRTLKDKEWEAQITPPAPSTFEAFEKWWMTPGNDDMDRLKTPYLAAKNAWLAAAQQGIEATQEAVYIVERRTEQRVWAEAAIIALGKKAKSPKQDFPGDPTPKLRRRLAKEFRRRATPARTA